MSIYRLDIALSVPDLAADRPFTSNTSPKITNNLINNKFIFLTAFHSSPSANRVISRWPEWTVATKRRYNPTLIFNIFFNELNVTFSRQCDRLLSWKTNTDAQHNETAQLTVLAAECDQRELIMEVINKVPVARRIRRIKGGKLQVGLSVWQNRIIIFRRNKYPPA